MAEEIEKCPRCGSTELKEVDQFSAAVYGVPKVIIIPKDVKKLKICQKCQLRIRSAELEDWLKKQYE